MSDSSQEQFLKVCSFISSKNEHVEEFQQLVKANNNVACMIDDDGRTLLHRACTIGNDRIVKFLLDAKLCDLKQKDEYQWMPIHSAASAGHAKIVSLLINAGSPLKDTTETGATPLHYAASKGRIDVVRLLVRAGASMDSVDNNGHTPIMKAVCTDNEDVVEYLLKQGCILETSEKYTGDNLLHICVNNKNVSIGSLIYKAAPYLSSRANEEGKTPADLATTSQLLEWKAIKENMETAAPK